MFFILKKNKKEYYKYTKLIICVIFKIVNNS